MKYISVQYKCTIYFLNLYIIKIVYDVYRIIVQFKLNKSGKLYFFFVLSVHF